MAGAECTELSALQKAAGTSPLMVAGLKEAAGALAVADGVVAGAIFCRTGTQHLSEGAVRGISNA